MSARPKRPVSPSLDSTGTDQGSTLKTARPMCFFMLPTGRLGDPVFHPLVVLDDPIRGDLRRRVAAGARVVTMPTPHGEGTSLILSLSSLPISVMSPFHVPLSALPRCDSPLLPRPIAVDGPRRYLATSIATMPDVAENILLAMALTGHDRGTGAGSNPREAIQPIQTAQAAAPLSLLAHLRGPLTRPTPTCQTQ